MWRHTMTKYRLINVFTIWKRYLDDRRGQYAVAASMKRMLEQRILQSLFTAWSLLNTTYKMALRREQRELQRWRRTCWHHWKLRRVSCRWRRSQQLILLQLTFSKGFKRYALQQQACREICLQTARNLLLRALTQWRVELWLALNQHKLILNAKHNALMHWKAFVAACRQKRRWEYYVQQLHRSQTRFKASTLDQKCQIGGIFRHARALQSQLKRNRVLLTHVLHAWYLVVQNRPLELWAHRVMEKCFLTWREQSVGKRAELA
ncbi:uncharacterized protein PITG_11911 [Phytophthora infestans T30-4]|uniref:Uncharacterized protein n=1 Tax=Phytophthora infestans (strain T30-4) TaxID=403677 RepID=D0NHI5_PHYIT|nr:uncharacterized protein PITG_11911 [Phytophthora infestans T30-4]EEY58910.1 hypothetical protein PITG_11911 [Phytophthora infestans T30-4]|eukprot:XP_002901383.1 hypothetical protein PITG_11911 [Phytophthora infestans T30-4]